MLGAKSYGCVSLHVSVYRMDWHLGKSLPLFTDVKINSSCYLFDDKSNSITFQIVYFGLKIVFYKQMSVYVWDTC